MVTPVAVALKAAVHAVSALAWADDPPAVSVPVRLGSILDVTPEAAGVDEEELDGVLVLEHPARAIAAVSATAPMTATFVNFTVFPSG